MLLSCRKGQGRPSAAGLVLKPSQLAHQQSPGLRGDPALHLLPPAQLAQAPLACHGLANALKSKESQLGHPLVGPEGCLPKASIFLPPPLPPSLSRGLAAI